MNLGIKSKPRNIKLFRPHKYQAQIIEAIEDDSINNIVICAGRRFGKSEMCINVLLKWALENTGTECAFITPSDDQRRVIFSEFLTRFSNLGVIKRVNSSLCDVLLTNGSEIVFRLGSYPAIQNLRGNAFSLIILDEFSSFRKGVYAEVLQPTFATMSKYKAIFISTPRGKAEFFDLYNNEKSGVPGWRSFHFPTSCSPFVNKDFLEKVRLEIPERIFRQEYLAEFLSNGGEVFTNLDSCIDTTKYNPEPNKEYFIGVDIGIMNDYTVITVVDNENTVVDFYRINGCSMTYIVSQIERMWSKWNKATVRVENNMYQGIIELLVEKDVDVIAFNTNTKSKKDIIERLCLLFEQKLIKIPDNQVLIDELINYSYVYNPVTRNVSYNAPAGLHDDCVMSLAIACWGTYFI